MPEYARRPKWLKLSPLNPAILARMSWLIRDLKLHTVCEDARCPNRSQCFAEGTATFMILGNICTRNCTFCAVKKGRLLAPDSQEPEHIATAVKKLGLQHVVVTSVTRDDLSDGGASYFAQTIKAIYSCNAGTSVEVLIPDFRSSLTALQTVVDACPTILNHNVETVPRLYHEVRPEANYQQSVKLFQEAKLLNNGLLTKSGLMLGLGETQQEVIEVMNDLRQAGCEILTIGQYLQPSLRHHKVIRYVLPEEFEEYQNIGKKLGFLHVASGPLVRSSFQAAKVYRLAKKPYKMQN